MTTYAILYAFIGLAVLFASAFQVSFLLELIEVNKTKILKHFINNIPYI